MLSHDKNGLGRALSTPTSGTGRRRRAASSSTLRGRVQKLGIAAAVTGMIAMTALSTAHAETGLVSAARDLAAGAVSAPATQAAVSADAGSALVFDRPQVSSTPAPEPAPSPAAESAPVQAAAGSAAVPSAPLRAPLASLDVSSPFGFRGNPLTGAAGEMHTGIDLAGACDTPVLAAAAGTVTEAGWSPYGGGNRIVVDHGNGLKTTYNHLANIGVSMGQTLAQGGQLAGVGTTGNSTGCHLHFEVMVNDQTVDPATYL